MSVASPELLFHTWYATKASLTALVPVADVFTGDCQDESQARPYVTVNIESVPTEHRSGGQYVERSELIIDSFHDDWQDGKDFHDELKAQLHNTAISTTGISSRLVRLGGAVQYIQEPDEVWHFASTYEMDHEAS